MSHFRTPPRTTIDPETARSVMLAEWGKAIAEDTTVPEHAKYLTFQDPKSTHTYADIMELRVEHIVKRAQHKWPLRKHDVSLLNIIHTMLKPSILSIIISDGAYAVPSPIHGRYFLDEA